MSLKLPLPLQLLVHVVRQFTNGPHRRQRRRAEIRKDEARLPRLRRDKTNDNVTFKPRHRRLTSATTINYTRLVNPCIPPAACRMQFGVTVTSRFRTPRKTLGRLQIRSG